MDEDARPRAPCCHLPTAIPAPAHLRRGPVGMACAGSLPVLVVGLRRASLGHLPCAILMATTGQAPCSGEETEAPIGRRALARGRHEDSMRWAMSPAPAHSQHSAGGNDLDPLTARRGDGAGGHLGQRLATSSGWEHPSPPAPHGRTSTCPDSHWGLWPCPPRSGQVWALNKQCWASPAG